MSWIRNDLDDWCSFIREDDEYRIIALDLSTKWTPGKKVSDGSYSFLGFSYCAFKTPEEAQQAVDNGTLEHLFAELEAA